MTAQSIPFLHAAQDLLNREQREAAREQLAHAIVADPSIEEAWLALAWTANTPATSLADLQRAIQQGHGTPRIRQAVELVAHIHTFATDLSDRRQTLETESAPVTAESLANEELAQPAQQSDLGGQLPAEQQASQPAPSAAVQSSPASESNPPIEVSASTLPQAPTQTAPPAPQTAPQTPADTGAASDFAG